jgi:hypothetical protein
MSKKTHFLVLACLFAFTASAVASTGKDPAGDKAMRSYVLTMPKVQAYSAASDALKAAMKANPGLVSEGSQMDTEPQATFADLEAKVRHHPHYFAFFAKQGLSVDDTVLVPLTLLSACSVAQYPQIAAKMADTVSPGQIAFCKAHMTELHKMPFFSGGSD